MRFRMLLVATAIVASIAPALAQGSTMGGANVDPRGAIRSVGRSVHRHHHHHRHSSGTKIPDYGGHLHRPADALPPGTTRPGPSRTFRPAR